MSSIPVLCALIASVPAAAAAQEAAEPTPPKQQTLTPGELLQEKKNPFSKVIQIPVESDTAFGVGSRDGIGQAVNIQPRFPLALGHDWNVISRTLIPLIHTPDPEKTYGLGDLQPSFFVTPAHAEPWVWGLGPALQFPTATNSALGTGKWSVGPTGALIYTKDPWFAGVIATQLWSFAGARRSRVNQTSLETSFSYGFASGWYVQSEPSVTYDWTAAPADAWTVPVGLDVGKQVQIGAQAWSFQLGAYYFVKRPSETARWVLRAQISVELPKKNGAAH
jgi:hypothetical protein